MLAGGDYTGVALQVNASMSLTVTPGAVPVLHGDGPFATDVITISAGTVSVSGLTVTGGFAGITVNSGAGPLSVTGSTLSGNQTGLNIKGESPPATVSASITSSTITGNTSDGMDLQGAVSLTAADVTVTENSGDGIFVNGDISLAAVGMTISANGYGIENEANYGGPLSAVVSVGSSVIAANHGPGCTGHGNVPFTDAGYNVVSDSTCAFGPSSKVNAGDVGLGPLAGNGSSGPQTEAIGTTSPAYRFVPVTSTLCTSFDERGVPRPDAGGPACDAGAYEYHQPVTLAQAAPTSGTVTAGTPFADQLAVTGALGPVSYSTTSPPGQVSVSAAGAVTASATVPAGVYQLAGTTADPFGDTGTWAYTLTVTGAGPARADLSVSLTAPAVVKPSAHVQVTATVANAGRPTRSR